MHFRNEILEIFGKIRNSESEISEKKYFAIKSLCFELWDLSRSIQNRKLPADMASHLENCF